MLSGVFLSQELEQGNLPAAGSAPGRPKVDEKGLAVPLGELVRLVLEVRQGDIRQRSGHQRLCQSLLLGKVFLHVPLIGREAASCGCRGNEKKERGTQAS